MPHLWDFSLRFYASDGVADACLSLQDQHATDVNLLLFALWEGYCNGRALSEQQLATARAGTGTWRAQVVQPLRQVRRHLKADGLIGFHPAAGALRQRVKEMELEAERLELEHLQRSATAASGAEHAGVERAMHNVDVLLATQGIALSSGAARTERTVLRQALEAFLTAGDDNRGFP